MWRTASPVSLPFLTFLSRCAAINVGALQNWESSTDPRCIIFWTRATITQTVDIGESSDYGDLSYLVANFDWSDELIDQIFELGS